MPQLAGYHTSPPVPLKRVYKVPSGAPVLVLAVSEHICNMVPTLTSNFSGSQKQLPTHFGLATCWLKTVLVAVVHQIITWLFLCCYICWCSHWLPPGPHKPLSPVCPVSTHLQFPS